MFEGCSTTRSRTRRLTLGITVFPLSGTRTWGHLAGCLWLKRRTYPHARGTCLNADDSGTARYPHVGTLTQKPVHIPASIAHPHARGDIERLAAANLTAVPRVGHLISPAATSRLIYPTHVGTLISHPALSASLVSTPTHVGTFIECNGKPHRSSTPTHVGTFPLNGVLLSCPYTPTHVGTLQTRLSVQA